MTDTPAFAYVSFIRAEPKAIWEALTTEAFTRRYWFGLAIRADGAVGSTFEMTGEKGLMVQGEILESKPYERLSYSWRPMFDEEMKAEQASKVTFTLEPREGAVRLSVIHEGFPAGSKVFPDISTGWPAVLSNLKSFLETGEALNLTKLDVQEAAA